MSPNAYLLVSHGSRDSRPEIAMRELARLVSQKLPNQELMVGTATLEMSSQPLHIQIQQFAQSASSSGYSRLEILPLFLLQGVHMMKDIPAEVALAQEMISQNIIIDLRPHLGSHSGLGKLLAKSLANLKPQATILLAHGSRLPDSLQQLAVMAASLGAVLAYWSLTPSLESRVQELLAAGYREMAILSYFLFPSSITDAIAQSIETLKLQFPEVSFHLTPPLGASAELADLIWDLTHR